MARMLSAGAGAAFWLLHKQAWPSGCRPPAATLAVRAAEAGADPAKRWTADAEGGIRKSTCQRWSTHRAAGGGSGALGYQRREWYTGLPEVGLAQASVSASLSPPLPTCDGAGVTTRVAITHSRSQSWRRDLGWLLARVP
jgi:hypothetical protein